MTKLRELSEHQIDGILLLVAMGATTEDIAQEMFGATARTLERYFHDNVGRGLIAIAASARGQLARNHGTPHRYGRGCRCPECKDANRERMRELHLRAQPPKGAHGTLSGYQNHGCRCDPCKEAGREANAELRRRIRGGEIQVRHGTTARIEQGCDCLVCEHERKRMAAILTKRNSESLEHATRHGRQWTGPELDVVLRDDLTVDEVSRLIGRSNFAVTTARSRARHDPKFRRMVGETR